MRNAYIIEQYQAANGEYRWRMKRNGRIIADSGEGYKTLRAMRQTLKRMLEGITKQNFVVNNLIVKK